MKTWTYIILGFALSFGAYRKFDDLQLKIDVAESDYRIKTDEAKYITKKIVYMEMIDLGGVQYLMGRMVDGCSWIIDADGNVKPSDGNCWQHRKRRGA